MKNKAISEDRKQYLRKVKAKKVVVIVTQLAIVLGFIILWEILANANVIDSFITSQPSRVWETLTNLSQNDLLKHIGITSLETIIGFLTGTILRYFNCNCFMVVTISTKSSRTVFSSVKLSAKSLFGSYHYYMGGSGNASYYCDGNLHFSYCNHIRNFKWFSKYRQRKNKNGKNI